MVPTRDVEVWGVDVLSGRRPLGLSVLEAADATRPRLMSPGKEEKAKF